MMIFPFQSTLWAYNLCSANNVLTWHEINQIQEYTTTSSVRVPLPGLVRCTNDRVCMMWSCHDCERKRSWPILRLTFLAFPWKGWRRPWKPLGCAIAQSVNLRLPIAVVCVQSQVSHVDFVVDEMALGRFPLYCGFPCQFSIHQLLYIHWSSYHPTPDEVHHVWRFYNKIGFSQVTVQIYLPT
jgi:hypothetical protein